MRVIKGIPLLLVILTALFLSGQTLAQSDQGESARVFGLGQPTSVQSLPAGKLRNRLESLPPQASGKALRWLQDFSFPEADLETIEVDDEGNVFYGDTLLPDPEEVDGAASAGPTLPANAPTATLDDAFLLHSRSGSSNVVFIDFDGAIITGRAWNGTHSQLDALPYNVEGDGSTFSTLERTRIVDIWHRVSEDLAAYDIDVTTEEPATFTSTTGTILVTNSVDANGNNINCTSCGGVAYVGVFGRSNYHTYYSPALVFFNKLGGGGETYVAEASSHEFGHNLGLSHDGTNAGTTYYSGHGSGLVSWAPIMGNSYNNNITEWSIGEYPDANQQQDDLDIIDGKLGYRPDDHGDTRAAAATLAVDPDGSVVASNPELDPHNVLTENKGVIGSSADVDVFSFVSGDGTVNLTVNPGWDAFYRSSSRRGSNLDIEAELQDLSGATVALSDPNTDTAASINASVSAGTYYLLVTGVGNAVTPYSDYNSMGQYFVNGSVPAASVDTTKPTPNPMGWASAPSATSDSAINMTALTASDDISAVEYNFLCTFGGTGCANSGWQSGTSHTASGLAASTSYTFQVKARDQAGNETAPSGSVSVSTDAPPPPPLAPSALNATGVSENSINLSWTDNAGTETGYRVERSVGGLNNFAFSVNLGSNATSYSDSGLAADTTYDYRVAAVNNSGDSDFATASGTTDAPPAYTNYSASGETVVAGSVSGSVSNTVNDDDSNQSITERDSGGKPANRHTYLEHRWNFNLSAGATTTVYANIWSGDSTDDDTFNLEYSLDNGGNFYSLFNVSSTASSNMQFAAISGNHNGSIIIRVVDTDQTRGHREQNTVFVDHLYIQVGNPSNDPPDGNPANLNATAASSSQINLTWTNGSSNESGFKVERSADGSSGWTEIADLPATSTSHSDTGLTAEKTYYYRVSAYTQLEMISAYASANATTPVAPPPPALSLSASGYKAKGKHGVNLSWSGSTSVDVYRDGSLLNPSGVVSGSTYDDYIGAKGGATYTHQVCQAETTTCSKVTTTVF
jgi:hypothetical protein